MSDKCEHPLRARITFSGKLHYSLRAASNYLWCPECSRSSLDEGKTWSYDLEAQHHGEPLQVSAP